MKEYSAETGCYSNDRFRWIYKEELVVNDVGGVAIYRATNVACHIVQL